MIPRVRPGNVAGLPAASFLGLLKVDIAEKKEADCLGYLEIFIVDDSHFEILIIVDYH